MMKRVELQGMVRWGGAAEPKARKDSGNTQLYGLAPLRPDIIMDLILLKSGSGSSGGVCVCVRACIAARRLEDRKGGLNYEEFTPLRPIMGRGLRITTDARRPLGGGEGGMGETGKEGG
jgi:hypothetical protein